MLLCFFNRVIEICTIMIKGQNQTQTENLMLTETKPAVNKEYTQKGQKKSTVRDTSAQT